MDANRPAHALTERAEGALAPLPVFHRALADPSLTRVLDDAARRFGYVVL